MRIIMVRFPAVLATKLSGRTLEETCMTQDASDPQLARLNEAIGANPDRADCAMPELAGSRGWDAMRRPGGFLAAIALDPTHFGALNDLGTLLYRTDFRTAARLAYAEAVRHHPENPVGTHQSGQRPARRRPDRSRLAPSSPQPWRWLRTIPTLIRAWPICCSSAATGKGPNEAGC